MNDLQKRPDDRIWENDHKDGVYVLHPLIVDKTNTIEKG